MFNFISLEQTQWARLAAAAMAGMAPVIVLGLIAQRHIVKGLTVGAVQGRRPAMSAASVWLAGIVKRHGAVTALAGIDLEVAPGEFFSLLGPSGSGKTTTLRILAGLEQADAGTVRMNGADVTPLEPGARDVAMVFQSYALYPHMTVRENIAFPLRMMGVSTSRYTNSLCTKRLRACG